MGKFSSRKGAAFERRVAKLFSHFLGIEVLRTPQSGGWGHAKTKGDLVPEDPVSDFPFFVEAKNEQSWDLWSMLFSNRGPVHEWWVKAMKQAETEGKIPMLVLGHDKKPPLVMVPEYVLSGYKLPFTHVDNGANVNLIIEDETVVLTRLDALLSRFANSRNNTVDNQTRQRR